MFTIGGSAYCLLLALIAFSFLLLANNVLLAWRFRKGQPLDFGVMRTFPKVSIVKPIRGIDRRIEENLESFYSLDYPEYDIIIGVEQEYEERYKALIERLSVRYPHVATKLVIVDDTKVVNPKIHVLSKLEPHCSGDLIWATDADVLAERESLKRLAHEHVVNGAHIVFSLYRVSGNGTLGSITEMVFHNTYSSLNILSFWTYFRIPITIGKSLLIETKTLRAYGGFSRFKEYLADDILLGREYREKGAKVSMNVTWIPYSTCTASIADFWHRLVRYTTMRYQTRNILHYAVEITAHPLALGSLLLLFPGSGHIVIFLLIAALSIGAEYVLLFFINTTERGRPGVVFLFPAAVVLKDVLCFIALFVPLFGNRVLWRGREISVGKNTRILAIRDRAA